MFWVKCLLIINLDATRYMESQFTGLLIEKGPDIWLVDFEAALSRIHSPGAKPYVRRVSSNQCIFIGGPNGN